MNKNKDENGNWKKSVSITLSKRRRFEDIPEINGYDILNKYMKKEDYKKIGEDEDE